MQRMTDIPIPLDAEAILRGHGIGPARARSGIVGSALEILAELPDLLDPAT